MFHKFKVNNDLLGILYMLLCQFSFATNDAFVKVIYQNYDEIFVLNQIIFIRGIFTLLFILLFLYFKKECNFKLIFTSNELRGRGSLESLAAIFFFIGIALLPFANFYILLSMALILLTAFGAIFLNEKVRWLFNETNDLLWLSVKMINKKILSSQFLVYPKIENNEKFAFNIFMNS